MSPIGTLVAAKKIVDSQTYYQYPQYDHRGSVCTLTDITGNVIASYKYDAWGNILESEETADVVAAGNRFKYQSNWMYLKEGVYLSPARLYHAQYGSFLQQDPLYKVGFLSHAFAFGSRRDTAHKPYLAFTNKSLYEYANSSPLISVDKYGLYEKMITGDGAWYDPVTRKGEGVQLDGFTRYKVGDGWWKQYLYEQEAQNAIASKIRECCSNKWEPINTSIVKAQLVLGGYLAKAVYKCTDPSDLYAFVQGKGSSFGFGAALSWEGATFKTLEGKTASSLKDKVIFESTEFLTGGAKVGIANIGLSANTNKMLGNGDLDISGQVTVGVKNNLEIGGAVSVGSSSASISGVAQAGNLGGSKGIEYDYENGFSVTDTNISGGFGAGFGFYNNIMIKSTTAKQTTSSEMPWFNWW